MLFLRPLVFILFLLSFFSIVSQAQCITSFPYTEDFENSNGGWTTGGNASDWAWGIPNKPAMLRAGNGAKCWIAGGLTGNHYNDNEASWLQGPCFDFTNITLPYFSFLINWNTETGYDGAGVQYSVDNGVTWQSAGAYGEPSTGCTPDNWYTDANIRYAVQPDGWSGSSLNSGRDFAGWVRAYHSFPQLAGKSNVRFRFVFGAGNIKNDYGGVGIDEIYVGETLLSNQLSFTYTCTPTARQADFFSYYSDCIDFHTLQWNFDDPASGDANIVSNEDIVHDFSAAGLYHVTLTGKDNFGDAVSSTQIILIPDVTAVVKTPVSCNGGTGTIETNVTNTTAQVSYAWSTDPVITSSSAEVKAGYYIISATAAGGCMNYTDITLYEPAALQHDVQTMPANCNNLNGSIGITETGGAAPYQYLWSYNLSQTSAAGNLSSGNYSITIKDKNGCKDDVNITLPKQSSTLTHNADISLPDCGVSNGSINIMPSGGTASYTYQWNPDVSDKNEAQNIPAGNYTIITTDNSQCRDTAVITLLDKPFSFSLGNDTFVCKGQSLLLQPAETYTSYLWNDGSVLPQKEVNKEGNYSLTVTRAGGCKASDTIHISVGCGDLVFPSGFTPNGDGLNEEWGAGGGVSLVSSYQMLVYNRYGDIVFQSTNPFQKWKGDVKGRIVTGTYVFVASYTYQGKKKLKKGTITLLL